MLPPTPLRFSPPMNLLLCLFVAINHNVHADMILYESEYTP